MYIPSRFSVCPGTVTTAKSNAVLIGNLLLHILKGTVGSDGCNRILDIRKVLLRLIISDALLCSCKPITIIRVALTNPSVPFEFLTNMEIVLIFRLVYDAVRPPLWSSVQSFWLQIQRSRVRFPALPDFLSSSGSGTGSTQPREVN